MSQPKKLHRVNCSLCGKPFERVTRVNRPPLVCSKACQYGPDRFSAKGLANLSDGMKRRNPMRLVEVRERMAATLRRIKHGPKVRGGNGHGPTKAEVILSKAIGWPTNVVVSTGKRTSGLPTCYKLDVADAKSKTCIEVDGASHHGKRRQLDAKKTAFLNGLGWKVFRVSNREVTEELPSIISKLKALIPTLRTTS